MSLSDIRSKKLNRQIFLFSIFVLLATRTVYASSTENVSCDTPLCQSILEAQSEQRSPASVPPFNSSSTSTPENTQPLNSREYLDHAANRFGYGLSSMDRVTTENEQQQLIKALNSIHNDAIQPRPFIPWDLNNLAKNFSFKAELPNNHIIEYNPILNSRKELARVQSYIEKMAKKVSDSEERRRITSEALKVNSNTAKAVAQFRTLISAFGSEYKVNNTSSPQLKDQQSNFASILQEFWFNHFNLDYKKVGLDAALGEDGYEKTLHNKMNTTFFELLRSVIRHTAMLRYLNNQRNIYDAINDKASNQNLGRELLELHTLGQGPGEEPNSLYGQEDVEASAKMLTGLNIKKDGDPEVPSEFVYTTQMNPFSHVVDYHFDKKTGTIIKQVAPRILKKRFCLLSSQIIDDEDGNQKCPVLPMPTDPKGEERLKLANKHVDLYLRFLASHPATKKNICTKLTSRFIATKVEMRGDRRVEVMRSSVIARCEEAWGEVGNLKAMYLAILLSPETFSRDNYFKMTKNPNDLVISAIRSSGISTTDLSGRVSYDLSEKLFTEIRKLGLPYRNWMTPDGYPLIGWISKGLLVRWTKASFTLTSVLESITQDKTTPIMKINPTRGIAGSFEEKVTKFSSATEKFDLVHQVLGLGRLGETDYIRKLSPQAYGEALNILDPLNNFLITQKIGGDNFPVPAKTSLNIEVSNVAFLRK